MPNSHVPADGEAMPTATAFLAVTPQMRSRLAATCEALIALLDELDGDEHLEDGDEDAQVDDDRCDVPDAGDDEHELGWQEEGSQATLHASIDDLEPSLGWTGHGRGWHEGETTEDLELVNEDGREDSLDGGRTEHGIADRDAIASVDFNLAKFGDGSGVKIAKAMLKRVRRKPSTLGADSWTRNLPPEAFESLFPEPRMYRAPE